MKTKPENKKRVLTPEEKRECAALNTIYQSKKKSLGLRAVKLADECGKSPAAISHYLSGVNALNLSIATFFAIKLSVPIAAFSSRLALEADQVGTASKGGSADDNVDPGLGPCRSYEYPEISEVSAGSAIEAIDLLQPGEGDRHQSDAWAGPHGFWLRVRGDSMTRSSGISFPEGMIVLVSPCVEPTSGKFIVAKIGNDVTFKQYVVDAGVRYLKPLNPSFQQQIMDDRWQLVGAVIDAKWPKSIF